MMHRRDFKEDREVLRREAPAMSEMCMVCGDQNRHSMGFQFLPDGEGRARAEGEIPLTYQGFSGLAHGGAVAAVLDDAMWWAISLASRESTMTAKMSIRYHRPVRVETGLILTGEVKGNRGRMYTARGSVFLGAKENDRPLAEASGTYLVPHPGEDYPHLQAEVNGGEERS